MRWLKLFFLILLIACLNSAVCGETVYFLVAEMCEPWHNDSYVLPLTEPNDIAHARDLIEYGPGIGAHIVGAAIDRWDPNNGINENRDYLQPRAPAWSWYATFEGFADQAIEVCDGIPSAVEDELDSWLELGCICFWGYTVVEELGSDVEPWNCDLDISGAVDFNDLAWFTSRWLDSDCCHRYWCEGADLDGSGGVDMYDYTIFANQWLWEE